MFLLSYTLRFDPAKVFLNKFKQNRCKLPYPEIIILVNDFSFYLFIILYFVPFSNFFFLVII